jgi:hypothetical protein
VASETRKLGQTPAEVRIEIARARAQISSSAAALKEQAAQLPEWREWVRKKPGLFIAGALALGFFIGYRRRSH